MRERYWFKVHKLRIGWAPNTWQGWIVVILYLIVVIFTFIQIDSQSHSVNDTLLNFIPKFFALSALLIIVTYLKGEPITSGSKDKDRKKST